MKRKALYFADTFISLAFAGMMLAKTFLSFPDDLYLIIAIAYCIYVIIKISIQIRSKKQQDRGGSKPLKKIDDVSLS